MRGSEDRGSRLGLLLRARRRERGMSLRAAARAAGVSPSTFSRLERGEDPALPSGETLAKLSAWLGVPAGALLAGERGLAAEKSGPALSTPERIEALLRSDPRLSPRSASALARAVGLLYRELAQSREEEDTQGKEAVGRPPGDDPA